MIARAPAQALTSAVIGRGDGALLTVALGCKIAEDPEPQPPTTSTHAAAIIPALTRVLLVSMASPSPRWHHRPQRSW
jgi:hypothetical protein